MIEVIVDRDAGILTVGNWSGKALAVQFVTGGVWVSIVVRSGEVASGPFEPEGW